MQRTPLASNSSNRRHNQKLSSYQRGLVVRAASVEASVAKVNETTNLPWSIVKTILFKASSCHNGVIKSRSDRPKTLSNCDERHIVRIARLKPKIIYRELLEKSKVECHRKTIYRLLKEYGLTNWLAKKRFLLTFEVALKRYIWCWERRDWTYDQWKLFIFNDECSMKRDTKKRRQWVFRTPVQKWNKDMIQSYKKGHDVNVMVWASIWSHDRSDLIRLTRDS